MKKKKSIPQLRNVLAVVCYARVSSDKQAKEETIFRQHSINRVTLERFLRDNADKNPQHIGDFSDEGYNFETEDERTSFWRNIIPLVKDGRISHIITTNIDRIFRGESAELKGKVEDIFRRNNITILSDNSITVFSPDDTQGRLTTSIMTELGTISKLELVKVMHSGRRRRLAEEGEWFLSIAPYGYRIERLTDGRRKKYKYHIVEEEAEVVRSIFDMYTSPRERLGANRIANEVNRLYPDSRKRFAERNPNFEINEKWDRQAVLRLLRATIYVGELDVTFGPSRKVSGFSSTVTSKTILV